MFIVGGCPYRSGDALLCVVVVKVDGCVFAIYNVGMMDHAVGVQQQRVSDGLYHVVRFTRDGPNSSLQIDQLPVRYKRPTGTRQLPDRKSGTRITRV